MSNEAQLRVLGISGSLRAGSLNTALLRAARELGPEGMNIELFDLRGLPLYDGDVETSGDPDSVSGVKEAIRNADGLLVATPEYNHGTSGTLKNAIDWASRDRRPGSIRGKPVAVVGAGGRSGAASARQQLEPILRSVGSLLMTEPGVGVQMAWQKFDAEGNLIDLQTRIELSAQLEAFRNWIEQVTTNGDSVAA